MERREVPPSEESKLAKLAADDPAELIHSILTELDVSSPRRLELQLKLTLLIELLFEWSQRMNLTGHQSRSTMVKRLLAESLALASVLPPAETLVDVGSGAGFPGIPLAVLDPNLRVTLIESRERRHHFQRHLIRSLHLPNVIALHGRVESLEPWPHDIAVAQAVARPEAAICWMSRWLKPGGAAVLPGTATDSQMRPPEISRARTVRYRVPLGGPDLTVWIGIRQST